jgi:hypothetical protein
MAANNYSRFSLKRLLIFILILLVVFAFSSVNFAFADTESEETAEATEETEEPAEETADEGEEEAEAEIKDPGPPPVLLYRPVSKTYTYNPLTGEWGFDPGKIIQTRVVGVVVENHPAARPQWGMDDPLFAPDIILEGEVEGGISRMLWMWADFNKMPYMVGPVRSARPPFVRFSELFNAMFIHWGMSESEGYYTGADYYFYNDGVDHLDGMYFESSGPFGRNWDSGRSAEHLAVVYGNVLPEYLASYFNTARDDSLTSNLKFYETKEPRGAKASCHDLYVQFSNISKSTEWYYDKKTQKYYTSDFETGVARDNLLILMDTTYYVTKVSTTYCNYDFAGGDAYLASCGAVQNIKWTVENGKLRLYDPNTGEDVPLNPGKTYIGWASSNYGGYCSISGGEPEPDPVQVFKYNEPNHLPAFK